jgi:hypothetical protein
MNETLNFKSGVDRNDRNRSNPDFEDRIVNLSGTIDRNPNLEDRNKMNETLNFKSGSDRNKRKFREIFLKKKFPRNFQTLTLKIAS